MLVVRVWNDRLRVFENVYVSLGEPTLPACVSCGRQFGAVLNRENDVQCIWFWMRDNSEPTTM